MKMTMNRIEAIMNGIQNEVFGHMTPIIEQLMEQALENGVEPQNDPTKHFTSAGSKWNKEFNAYWSAVVELVRHTHEPLLSVASIPRTVKDTIQHIKNEVFKVELKNLWEMEDIFGFVPYKPHGRDFCYDMGDSAMNENAVGRTIALQRANSVEKRLLKCFRDGTWDGTGGGIKTAFNFPVFEFVYSARDCR